jgi:hypothetical protein
VNATDLQQLAFRFREARIVFAGVELGIFSALGSSVRSDADLADELELDPESAHVLLEALAAMGVLVRLPSGYAIEPECASALLPGGKDELQSMLRHDLWHWTSWAYLEQCVRQGTPSRSSARRSRAVCSRYARRSLPSRSSAST